MVPGDSLNEHKQNPFDVVEDLLFNVYLLLK